MRISKVATSINLNKEATCKKQNIDGIKTNTKHPEENKKFCMYSKTCSQVASSKEAVTSSFSSTMKNIAFM